MKVEITTLYKGRDIKNPYPVYVDEKGRFLVKYKESVLMSDTLAGAERALNDALAPERIVSNQELALLRAKTDDKEWALIRSMAWDLGADEDQNTYEEPCQMDYNTSYLLSL